MYFVISTLLVTPHTDLADVDYIVKDVNLDKIQPPVAISSPKKTVVMRLAPRYPA